MNELPTIRIRIRRLIGISLVLVVALSATGCNGRKWAFAPIGEVTSANLWILASDGSKYGWKISDAKDLSKIVAFVDSQRTNWVTPWYGIPVPQVEVQLFYGQRAKATFGAGKNFFETQRAGGFFSKDASPADIQRFFDSMNLDDATVKKYEK